MVPQHTKAWCDKGENCDYKWNCKFKHCGKDGSTWYKMGVFKNPQQIQAYEEAERRGVPEAPYHRPTGSPRRQPAAHPPLGQASNAKKTGEMNQERLRIKNRLKELQEVLVRETCKLSDPQSTAEDRAEAIRVITQTTTEMTKYEEPKKN